jgi:hypothetical protein
VAPDVRTAELRQQRRDGGPVFRCCLPDLE